MILIDVNLLIYAYAEEMEQHAAAKRWLDGVMSQPSPVGLPWPTLLGFVRVVTHPAAFTVPRDPMTAWLAVQQWLDAEPTWIPLPTSRHREVLDAIVRRVRPAGPLVPDAHLAALAIEHGLILMTADRGFARFPGLRWENPLDPG